MKELDIYLDTSVWNYIYADDTPEKKELTLQFFNRVAKGAYNIYIGSTVIDEIERTRDENKLKLLNDAVAKYNPIILKITNEVSKLAEKYVAEGVIPAKKRDDAYHIAFAICHKMDVLLSWNYQHLANVNKKHVVMAVNLKEGYCHEMEFVTPYEVVSDES